MFITYPLHFDTNEGSWRYVETRLRISFKWHSFKEPKLFFLRSLVARRLHCELHMLGPSLFTPMIGFTPLP